MASGLVEWGIERSAELLALVDASYPDDRLTLDEIESACWGEARVVLGRADGSAAISLRTEAERAVIEVVAERGDRSGPDAATPRLLGAAAAFARARAVAEIAVGGSMPDHLWPGLTAGGEDLVGSLVAGGYDRFDEVQVLAVPTSFRSSAEIQPPVVRVVRVVDDDQAAEVSHWISTRLPGGAGIVSRAIAQATCFAAVHPRSGVVVGVLVHSVGRDGWIGPVVVADDHRQEGVGRRLLAEACRDLMIAGLSEAPLACDIGATGSSWPDRFLESVGARPWRMFQRWRIDLTMP